MSKRKEIIRHISIYSLGTQLAQLITLVAAIISRRFLGPAQTGIWSTLQILVDYSKYSVMGTLEAATREIPYRIGKGEIIGAEKIKNLAFSFILSTSAIVSIGIVLFAIASRGWFPKEVSYGLFFIAILILLQRVNNLLISLLRCYKKFEIETGMMILSAIVNAILVGFLTFHFKIYGFIWAMIISFIFNIVYIYFHYRFNFKWEYDFSLLKPLLSYGFPLMLIGVLTLGIKSIDKIMIVKMMGFESLGLYSIALMACSYLSNFSIAIAIVFLPHFQERIAIHKNPRELENYLFKSSSAYTLIMPALIGSVWILAPYAIRLFLPKFVFGIAAMKVLVLSMFFIALTQPYQDFLIGIKKHFLLFPLLGTTLVIALLIDYWAIRSGFGIVGVAYATGFTSFFNFSIIYFFAAHYFVSVWKALQKYTGFLGCGMYFLAVFFLLDRWMPSDSTFVRAIFIQLIAFTVFYIPVLIVLNREFSVFTMVKQKILGLS